MTAAPQYTIVWCSPRNASNEGMYLVGTGAGLDAYYARYMDGGTWVPQPATGTKPAMLATAERFVEVKCAECRANGYDYYSIRPALVDNAGYIDHSY